MAYRPDPETAIDDLMAVANTAHGFEALYPLPRGGRRDDSGFDHLRTPGDTVAFLRGRLSATPPDPPSARERALLMTLRHGVRALAEGRVLAATRASLRLARGLCYRLDANGFRPDAAGWAEVAGVLVVALRTLVERRERLRVCANPGCGWVFIDRSRRGHRVWCSAGACGNRVKLRRYRQRLERSRRPEVQRTRTTRRR